MPFRERVKQVLKQAEDVLKTFYTSTGSTRPITPPGMQPHTDTPDLREQVGNSGAGLLGTPTSVQAPTSILLTSQLDDTLREDDNLVAIKSSSHLPDTGLQTVNTMNEPNKRSQAPESTVLKEATHKPLGAGLNRKDVKQLATGVAGQVIDTLKIGPLRDVSDLLQGFGDMYKMEGTVKREYEVLHHRLQALLKVLESHSETSASPIVSAKITGIREFIMGELNSIGKKIDRKPYGRFLMAKEEEERFMGCCCRIQEYMDQLSLDIGLSTWGLEEERSKDRMTSWVRLLPSSSSALYNSSAGADLKRRECTLGTRVDVLAIILSWADNNGMDSVYWINGMAGTGKTTIAYSACTELAAKHTLAASFFCSRLREDCRDVNRILPSIAYQLAQLSPPFHSALSVVIKMDQDAHHKILSEQFEMLIRKPLLSVLALGSHALEKMIVVIDALDECENKEATRDILDVLLVKSTDLPIEFIVSSRPEPQIRDQMTDGRARSRLILHELDTGSVQADIETYLREELKPMKPSPTESQIVALVEKAGILFIYAATAVRYIGYDNFQSDPQDRLRTILAGSESQENEENEEIDQLYITVLEAALGNRRLRNVERDNMQQVLHTVVCARDPLTVSGLSELLQIHNIERVRAVLRPLWSILHVVGKSELVTTLHASFPDFMIDSARAKIYYCDSDAQNRKLAKHCLESIMRTRSQFNISGLESSYIADDKVPNIEERVADAISSDLFYACRYWADHVEAGKCASGLITQLRGFLCTRLLLWMEVLNLKKHMRTGIECMKLLVEWCHRLENADDLVELANDAQRFVDTFASNPVSQSTPHLYISMLAFWPRSGPIAKHYGQFTHGPVEVEGTALNTRQLAHLATWVFEDAIRAMVVSQDGRYIALGTGMDVLVVDSFGGRVVLGPLRGHPDSIRSIVFSPHRNRVLAGSFRDYRNTATIIGWDTRTGDTVIGPLQLQVDVQTTSITCLTFSPDCSCIATGSDDSTVRLWNAENGQMLRSFSTRNSVRITAFSPDGTRIAAKSDNTLQVWNSQTGITTLGPLDTDWEANHLIAFFSDNSRIMHNNKFPTATICVRDAKNGGVIRNIEHGHAYLTCIGHSPDGRYIVTCGHGRTVQVWDAHNCKVVLGPLEGHIGRITSVAFSPDGSRIISACKGGLVCTWDTRQRSLAPNPISTRSSQIVSVKFSPDGQHFLSGSKDGSLHIWDSHTGAMVVGPIKAGAHEIWAVDFLNNRIVSGSGDGTISVFDASNRQAVLGPLTVARGHAIRVIAYSPNRNLIATVSGYPVLASLNLWDAQTGTKVLGPLTDPRDRVMSVQFSPDGTRIVSSSTNRDRQIEVWDVAHGTNVFGPLNGHTSVVNSVSYSPNGALIASGSADKTIVVWDAYTGLKVLGPLFGHSDQVRSVHFSPDSTRIVSGSGDRTLRIWNVQTGEAVSQLPHGHEQIIRSVAYSPDGTCILSLSYDMSVRINVTQTAKERALTYPTTEYGEWTMNKNGWVVDDQSRLLVWVPGDLRRALIWPRTQVMVASWGDISMKFDKPRMGESWAQSYTS